MAAVYAAAGVEVAEVVVAAAACGEEAAEAGEEAEAACGEEAAACGVAAAACGVAAAYAAVGGGEGVAAARDAAGSVADAIPLNLLPPVVPESPTDCAEAAPAAWAVDVLVADPSVRRPPLLLIPSWAATLGLAGTTTCGALK